MKTQTATQEKKGSKKGGKKQEAAPAVETPKATRATTERTAPVPSDSKITLVMKENPKRGKSAERYKLYRSGMTVGDFIKAGGQRADIKWDLAHGFIKVG